MATVTAYTRPMQAQEREKESIQQAGGHTVPFLHKEWLGTDGCQNREVSVLQGCGPLLDWMWVAILAFGRSKQVDCEFQTILSYKVRSCHKTNIF